MIQNLNKDLILEVALAFVYVVPTSFFRYRPFVNRFRFSIKVHTALYIAFFSLCNAVIIYLHQYDTFIHANRARFILYICMTLFSFFLVNENIFKQIYTICYFGNFSMFASVASLLAEYLIFRQEPLNLYFKLISTVVILIPVFPLIYKYFYPPLMAVLDKAPSEIWNILWIIGGIQLTLNATLSIPYSQSAVTFAVRNSMIRLSISIGSIIINATILLLIKRLIEANQKSMALEAEKQQLTIQEYQYRTIRKKIDDSRRFRHDFKHHSKFIFAILEDKDLSDSDKIQKLTTYCMEYFGTIPESEELRFCEHYSLNLLLNYYHNVASDIGCSFNANINVPQQMAIKDTDLCVIAGNLLLNAVEAVSEIIEGSRKINVSITKEGKHLLIMVENTFNGQLNQSGEKYYSTKHPGDGLGIPNIVSIASRYSGNCYFDHQENVFSARIHLVLEY